MDCGFLTCPSWIKRGKICNYKPWLAISHVRELTKMLFLSEVESRKLDSVLWTENPFWLSHNHQKCPTGFGPHVDASKIQLNCMIRGSIWFLAKLKHFHIIHAQPCCCCANVLVLLAAYGENRQLHCYLYASQYFNAWDPAHHQRLFRGRKVEVM